MTDSNQSIPEIIARDMSVRTRDFSTMDTHNLEHWAKRGLAPAQAELAIRRQRIKTSNGGAGVARRRLVIYDDNTEVEHE